MPNEKIRRDLDELWNSFWPDDPARCLEYKKCIEACLDMVPFNEECLRQCCVKYPQCCGPQSLDKIRAIYHSGSEQ